VLLVACVRHCMAVRQGMHACVAWCPVSFRVWGGHLRVGVWRVVVCACGKPVLPEWIAGKGAMSGDTGA
jgi:hypothetical protein